ncbi:TPA: hypothetical protein L3M66_004780 [Vibrio parahaemolyticus]|uniref:hypothetical protein n=1 Tax=Vibrio parahaemolyticus TaxID=670 RepID=UPI001122B811|nr:hypothetical protein [Vibrio parahaemolyticus]MCS0016564.1 hypothetical protein [Vibrio parahaemolyticus]TOB15022.1 hypothetical protein CGK10_23860 [Vibrio parahaemolyticus]HBN6206099.1 hypothetical protein [Vibrio parahaemolyticus]
MKTSLLLLLTLFLASCSSIKSIEEPTSDEVDGLTYYMPKKDFVVTVNVKSGKITKVSFGTTPAFPDLSKQYVLNHGSNFLGKNTLDVGITEKGLLTSSKSTTVSNVTDAFKNLATTYGQLRTFSLVGPPAPAGNCTTDGEHIFTYSSIGDYTPCSLNVSIRKASSSNGTKAHSKDSTESYSGIFYRQNEPYIVSAMGQGLNASSIVFSPSDSKTLFLPVSKTFFANNEADFAFVDGVPTKYKQDTDGEAIALLKLPADILGAYFGAVGSVFDSFKSNDGKEAEALNSSLSLELAKKKYAACIEAIEAKDDDLIEELECK